MTKYELVEKVARALATSDGVPESAPLGDYLRNARAALAIAVPAAFEMAAEVAEDMNIDWSVGIAENVCEAITAIRAEGEKWK